MHNLQVLFFFAWMKYAEVILPLPLENTYTYRIPSEIEPFVRVYSQVTVPLGKNRSYTAIVKKIHDSLPDSSFECKDIDAVLDGNPVIYSKQMWLWEWIASYYLCKTGEVYKAAVPPGLNRRRYVPKKETCIRLSAVCCNEEVMYAIFSSLKRAKQQERLLLFFVDLAQPFHPELSNDVSKKELLKKSGESVSVLDGLIKRGILESYEKEVSRIQQLQGNSQGMNTLTNAQEKAFSEIKAAFLTKSVCLLNGVSSSGKTEIYTHLISDTLQHGKRVLVLLPEIALTNRITERLANVFGNRLLAYHSGVSDNIRVEIWARLLHAKEPVVVIGVRSSVFLPFEHLGLVIVDEEHDSSYWQQDPAPRYHARNTAIMLAHSHGTKTLLCSATPSLESYHNAISGKYGLVRLIEPYGNTKAPLIRLENVKELRRRRIMKDSLFSPFLKEKMEQALKRGEQVVLFQNRRGFSLVMECKSCGHVVRCAQCDVSLTYHKRMDRLVCHYCGSFSSPLSVCPACMGKEIKLMGFGTEKVVEEIESLFPDVQTSRLDFDTARTNSAYKRILKDFEQGKSKILIGTQMLAKGLDYNKVGVVGILNADSLMNVPDFRAHERAFQLMMQVSSCAGLQHQQGIVVIQTSNPDHPLMQAVQTFDFEQMATTQLSERKMFRYPPYFRLITLVLRCADEQMLEHIAVRYTEILFADFGERVSPPFTPPVNRVQMLYVRHILLKFETSMPVNQVRTVLEQANRQMLSIPGFRKVVVHYEVDN